MGRFLERLLGAARFDVKVFEEVEADRGATGQAMLVILLSSLAGGVGDPAGLGIIGVVVGFVADLLGWIIWAALIYVLGAKVFPEKRTVSDVGELLRTTGFAAAPGLVRVLGFIPGAVLIVQIVATVWMLITMVIAVRQALDYTSTKRAILVCVAGWTVASVIAVVLASLYGPVIL